MVSAVYEPVALQINWHWHGPSKCMGGPVACQWQPTAHTSQNIRMLL